MKKIGIIGGAGYIGSHVTKKFLEKGFQVKVSVTDISDTKKYEHLNLLEGVENLEIEAVKVEDKKALSEFIKDCEILVHGGTPFQLNVEDPVKDLLDPTIKGTENFLNVVKDAPDVKKVVFIASVAAYNTVFPMPIPERDPDHIYSETDPPFFHPESHPYAQAKYHADQAVRNYLNDHPDLSFEIVTVSPVLVVGKSLSSRQDSTSVGFQYLTKNQIKPDPFWEMLFENDVEWAMVDVTDVAESVYRAATLNGLHGKNYLLCSDSWKMSDISLMLNNKSPKGRSRTVYSNQLASKDLGVNFKSPQTALNQFE